MLIHLGFIEQQIGLRKYHPKHQSDIGSSLKHRRKELNLTLEEMSEGLCSISYLSKIENNILLPSGKYIELLEERYKTEIKENAADYNNEYIDNIINALFYNLNYKMDAKILTGYNYRAKLYSFSQHIILKEYERARNNYFELNPYIKNMLDLELALFLYLTSILLKIEGRLKDAHKILDLYKSQKLPEKILLLIEKTKLELAFKTNNHSYILLNFDFIMRKLYRDEHFEISSSIKSSSLLYLSQYVDDNNKDLVISQAKNLINEEKDYLNAKIHYYNQEYLQAFEYLEKIHLYNEDYFVLYLITLNKLNENKKINNALKNKVKLYNKSHQLIVEYFNHKYVNEENLFIEFLKNEIIKVKQLPDHVIDLDFWNEEGVLILADNGFYKDALSLARQIKSKKISLSQYN